MDPRGGDLMPRCVYQKVKDMGPFWPQVSEMISLKMGVKFIISFYIG